MLSTFVLQFLQYHIRFLVLNFFKMWMCRMHLKQVPKQSIFWHTITFKFLYGCIRIFRQVHNHNFIFLYIFVCLLVVAYIVWSWIYTSVYVYNLIVWCILNRCPTSVTAVSALQFFLGQSFMHNAHTPDAGTVLVCFVLCCYSKTGVIVFALVSWQCEYIAIFFLGPVLSTMWRQRWKKRKE